MISRNLKWTLTLTTLFVVALVSAQSAVKWLTLDEAITLSKTEPRKFLVDVYTDWCGWCKKMDHTTYENAQVADYLNSHFYPVKFNAEQRQEIKVNDKTYEYVRNGSRGYNQYAAALTFNRLSFPTTVFLDENLKVIQPVPGYKNPDELQMMMKYFAEDHHKTTPWTKFISNQH